MSGLEMRSAVLAPATGAATRYQPHPRAVVPRPNPPFAVVRQSPTTIADEMREEHGRRLRNP
jgi:hypothetical protein